MKVWTGIVFLVIAGGFAAYLYISKGPAKTRDPVGSTDSSAKSMTGNPQSDRTGTTTSDLAQNERDLTELGRIALDRLPRKIDANAAQPDQIAELGVQFKASSEQIREIESRAKRGSTDDRRQAMLFFKNCAEKDDAAEPLRALCYKKWLNMSSVSPGLESPQVPPLIVEFAKKFN